MSDIRATTISALNGTDPITLTKQSAAKAWVNINGDGTISIRNSVNTSSIVDLSTGNYGQNFTSNFDANDNYSTQSTADDESWGSKTSVNHQNVSQARIQIFQGSANTNSGVDTYRAMMTHHGDLA